MPVNEGMAQAGLPAASGALGYAAVGLLALLLGVAVTLLGMQLKRRRDREDDEK